MMHSTMAQEREVEMGIFGNIPVDEDFSSSNSSEGEEQNQGSRFKSAGVALLSVSAVFAVGLAFANIVSDGTRVHGDSATARSMVPSSTAPAVLAASPVPASPVAVVPAATEPVSTAPVATVPVATVTVASPISVIPAAVAPVNARRSPNTDVLPDEHMHDGNLCDDTEEILLGLCYTKCSILTNSTHAHRFSAFSCCEQADCHGNVFKMKTASLIPCSGYDVSSADHGTACPHLRGTCLLDEEQFLGECFEKCSKLTNGAYPNRVAAMTCCNTEGVSCLDPFNDWTKPAFFAGGGVGDHDAETPRRPHFPEKIFAEAV